MTKKTLRTLRVILVRVVGAGAAFALNVLIARQLPQHEAGLLFLALAFVSVLSSIGIVGMNTAVVRFISPAASTGNWGEVNAIAVRAAGIATLALCLTSLGSFLLSGQISRFIDKPDFEPVIASSSPAILLVGLAIVIAHCLAARTEASRSIFVLSVGIPLGAVMLLLLVRPGSAAVAASLYSLAALGTVAIGLIWWVGGLPSRLVGKFNTSAILASGTALWIVTIMGQATQWSSQFVAAYWLPAEELASFAVAQRTAMLISFLSIAINLIVAPKYATLHAEGRIDELEKLTRRVLLSTAAASLPVFVIVCVFSRKILFIFGPEFGDASPSLIIMSLGQVVNLVLGSTGYLLTVTGHEKKLRNLVVYSGFTAIGLSLALVPNFGSLGAAVAATISVALQSFLTVLVARRSLGIRIVG